MDHNSFDAYLHDVHLSVDEFNSLSAAEKKEYRLEGYKEWLRSRTAIATQQLAPAPAPAPGIF
jgi:hypothetical protein